MDGYGRLRATGLSMIVRDTPAIFWSELRARAIGVYADVFAEVSADRNILADQKIDDLLQRRHFRMEKLLVDLAVRHGLSHSMSVILQNNRRHAYVFKDDISMTQSYIQTIGSLPQPAKFRERLANTMNLPRLDLGDEPEGAFVLRSIYGLIAHNPVGRRFHADEQRFGSIQFCLPAADCLSWAVELSVAELVASYPVAPSARTITRSLTWKNRPAADGSDKGKG